MPQQHSDQRSGFAIIISLAILAFVLLLLLSITALLRVETRVASDSLSRLEAKQNALLALNLAVGELQQHSGPDQRVTGRADLEIPSSVSIASGDDGETVQQKLDGYWQSQRNRQWTGVWRNTNTTT